MSNFSKRNRTNFTSNQRYRRQDKSMRLWGKSLDKMFTRKFVSGTIASSFTASTGAEDVER
jgi:hypothetical protein